MSTGRMIDYELLAQDAMRGVVRTVLIRTAKTGLPGDHHFYISFGTQAPGVSLSKRLKEKYPEEMTIVLQHRFWDLSVSEDKFEVKLTFDGIPERIVVPFAAIKVFFDPSVRYGLQFEAPDFGPDATAHPQAGRGDAKSPTGAQIASIRGPRNAGDRKPRAPRKTREKVTDLQVSPSAGNRPATSPATPRADETKTPAVPPPNPRPAAAVSDEQSGGAQVVSLDAFRKK